MKAFIFSIILLASLGCQAANLTESVSIINLISTPQNYEGKKVRIVGIVKIEFEGNAIYLTPSDLKNLNYKNGLWLTLKNDQVAGFKKFSGKIVLVEGVFSAKKKGHLRLWSGSISEISRIEEHPKSK